MMRKSSRVADIVCGSHQGMAGERWRLEDLRAGAYRPHQHSSRTGQRTYRCLSTFWDLE
jgi:hypothetical protein